MEDIVAGFAFGAIFAGVLSAMISIGCTDAAWKREVVARGAARYVCNQEGVVEFKWNDELKDQK